MAKQAECIKVWNDGICEFACFAVPNDATNHPITGLPNPPGRTEYIVSTPINKDDGTKKVQKELTDELTALLKAEYAKHHPVAPTTQSGFKNKDKVTV